MRFLSLLHKARQCAFGDGRCRLLIRQFFNLFIQFKATTQSHENCVFLYRFSNMAISPQNNDFFIFYTGKLYGLTGMIFSHLRPFLWCNILIKGITSQLNHFLRSCRSSGIHLFVKGVWGQFYCFSVHQWPIILIKRGLRSIWLLPR